MSPVARHRARPRSGFTLIEVVFALGILAVGLLALAAMQIQALRGGSTSRYVIDGTRIARDQVEQAQRMPFGTVAAAADAGWQVPPWINVPGFAAGQIPVQVTVPGGGAPQVQQLYNVAWRVTSVPGNTSIFNVDVEVSWLEPTVLNRLTRTGNPTVTLASVRYDW